MLPFSSKILLTLLMVGHICIMNNKPNISMNTKIVAQVSPNIRIVCIIFMYYTHTTGVVALVV